MTGARVLMTCDAVGGVWRYAADLAAALGQEDVDTLLVGTGPAPEHAALVGLDQPPVWLDLPPTWMAPAPSDVERLGDRLSRLQRVHRADLVHLNQPAEAAFLDVDVPVVAVAHSCLATWWRTVFDRVPPDEGAWRSALEADGFRRADLVVAPTASHAAAVRDSYGIALPAVVPNATAAPPGGSARDPVVVAAGRWWDPGKNVGVLDAAAASCRWPVLLFGSLDGPDGSRASVRHARPLGQRPAEEVHAALRRAAIFVSPSIYEPFGLAALEAARSGAALLLADIPTYRELWEGAARFFHPRSPAALAAALDSLVRDEAARVRLAAAAAARASGFTPEAQALAVRTAYGSASTDGALRAAG